MFGVSRRGCGTSVRAASWTHSPVARCIFHLCAPTRAAQSSTTSHHHGCEGAAAGGPSSVNWEPENTNYARLKAGADPMHRRRRTAPARDSNYDAASWARHKSVTRHWRHVFSMPRSGVLQRLLWPDLSVVLASAATVTFFNSIVVPAAAVSDAAQQAVALTQLTLPILPFSLCTLVLGLLTTFRTNQSHDRFAEARRLWGEVINTTRDLARQSVVWLPTGTGTVNRAATAAAAAFTPTGTVRGGGDDGGGGSSAAVWLSPSHQRLGKLLKSFPVALNFHLTTNGGHDALPCGSVPDSACLAAAELHAELLDVWPEGPDHNSDFHRVLDAHSAAGTHVPLTVLLLLADTLRQHRVDPVFAREMDQQLVRLNGALGGCERLLRTPIPTAFTRHTSRFLTVWCNLLPLALWEHTGLVTVPAALLVTYALLGIEDIGVQIEEPFDILPLRQYTQAVHDSVDTVLSART